MRELQEITSSIILKSISSWLPDDAVKNLLNNTSINSLFETPVLIGATHSVLSYSKNLSQAISYLKMYSNQSFIFSLTAGSVPLNNVSFPRGVWVGGVKFPFLSEAHINELVLLSPNQKLKFPKYRIFALKPGVDRRFFKELLGEIIESANNAKLISLRDQFSFLSYKLWTNYFDSNVPPYISLCAEDVVSALLIETQMKLGQVFHSTLFDDSQHQEWTKKWGSMFHGVREGFRMMKLQNKDNRLFGEGLEVELSPESLFEALKDRKIFPSYKFSEWVLIQIVGLNKFDSKLEDAQSKQSMHSNDSFDSILMQKRMSL